MFRALSIVTLAIGLSGSLASAQPRPAPASIAPTAAGKLNLVFRSWAPRALPALSDAPTTRRQAITAAPLAAPVQERRQILPALDSTLEQREQLRGQVTTQTGLDRVTTLDRIAELSLKISDRTPARRAEALEDSLAVVEASDFQSFAKADLALSRLALLQSQSNQAEDAGRTYARVLAEYPKSRALADAHVFLGDAAFARGDFTTATSHFERAAALASSLKLYARYKLGWTAFNSGEHQRALDQFQHVATKGRDPLRRAAASDAVRVYAEIGHPARALAFVDGLDRTRGQELARNLAETYQDQGKYAPARATWLAIARREKDASLACSDRTRAFAATVGLDNRADILRAASELRTAAAAGGACAAQVDQAIGEVAYAWHLERDRTNAEPSRILQMWSIAGQVATTPQRKAAIVRNVAIATWVAAASRGGSRAPQWIDAAVALEGSGQADLVSVSLDAWDNALRAARATRPLAPAQRARVRTALEKNGSQRALDLLTAL